jgi:hypothetical protein
MDQRKRKSVCAYCGALIAETGNKKTKEHIFPRNLFPKYDGYQPRKDFLTVPACETCNGGKSEDDEYLRNFLALRLRAMGHPDIDHLVDGFLSSAREGSRLVRRMAESARMARHPTTGLYLPYVLAVPIEDERLDRIMTHIVRGLYCKEHRSVLAADCCYVIREMPATDEFISGWVNLFVQMGVRPYREVGDGQCVYQTMRFPASPETTFWTICFFDAIWFVGWTMPPEIRTNDAISAHVQALLGLDDETAA